MSSEIETPPNEQHKEPSLGPACLVVAILSLAVFCIVCAFGSWFVFRDQAALAERGITNQLMPWVQGSALSQEDKQGILGQLREVVDLVRTRQLSSRQLTRLKNCLEDNPVLLWGVVEEVLVQVPTSDLTETEQEAARRTAQRLLRMTGERKLSRSDLEFVLDKCVRKRRDGMGIESLNSLDASQLREFSRRGQQVADAQNVSFETFDRRPAEVFESMVKDALTVP